MNFPLLAQCVGIFEQQSENDRKRSSLVFRSHDLLTAYRLGSGTEQRASPDIPLRTFHLRSGVLPRSSAFPSKPKRTSQRQLFSFMSKLLNRPRQKGRFFMRATRKLFSSPMCAAYGRQVARKIDGTFSLTNRKSQPGLPQRGRRKLTAAACRQSFLNDL